MIRETEVVPLEVDVDADVADLMVYVTARLGCSVDSLVEASLMTMFIAEAMKEYHSDKCADKIVASSKMYEALRSVLDYFGELDPKVLFAGDEHQEAEVNEWNDILDLVRSALE